MEDCLAEVDEEGQVRAVLLHRDGASLVERNTGSTPEDYWDTRSVTKSVVGTVVGIAVPERHIAGVDPPWRAAAVTTGRDARGDRRRDSAPRAHPYRRVRSRYRQPRTEPTRSASVRQEPTCLLVARAHRTQSRDGGHGSGSQARIVSADEVRARA